jgi:sodium-independent sulfate anion transporter 11
MDRNLYFPSVERFRNALTRVSMYNTAPNRTIVIDMTRVTQIDHTSLKVVTFINICFLKSLNNTLTLLI